MLISFILEQTWKARELRKAKRKGENGKERGQLESLIEPQISLTPALHIDCKSINFLKKNYHWEIQLLVFTVIALPKSLSYELMFWMSKIKRQSLSSSCTLHTLQHSLPNRTQANASHLFPKSVHRSNERANKVNPNATCKLNIHSPSLLGIFHLCCS